MIRLLDGFETVTFVAADMVLHPNVEVPQLIKYIPAAAESAAHPVMIMRYDDDAFS